MKALVVGSNGSIGRRHAEHLVALGVEVVCCDLGDTPSYPVDFAVIASPTSTHPQWIAEMNRMGIPFLCEKPVGGSSHDIDVIEDLKVSVPNMVACNLRFSESMGIIKSFVDQSQIISFHARISDGNPNRSKYSEGIALQDIHEFDYIQHLFGEIEDIILVPNYGHKSYEAVVRTKSGINGVIHGDAISQDYHRDITLTSTKRTNTFPIIISNNMYVEEIKYFMECLKNGDTPMNGLAEACKLTRMICEEYEYAK